MNLTNEKLEKLLDLVSKTCDDETIDCDECLKYVAQYAEEHLQGLTPCEQLQAVKVHLEHCICCQHEFEIFMIAFEAIMKENEDC
ncbi:hypothetical protein [Thalassoglobus polymorphus]|uniref:Uncharacterized protein n=1 Tax=Thalassoglobus polymorphus TaxID=2527994 RepID=A0A517QQ84_9PLAN|nr:hypothetical protein [Thalassoglobus polymorphus]QDT33791.1 hypothetical protein Mal48_30460 [Thalassoglobus polymorphus]